MEGARGVFIQFSDYGCRSPIESQVASFFVVCTSGFDPRGFLR